MFYRNIKFTRSRLHAHNRVIIAEHDGWLQSEAPRNLYTEVCVGSRHHYNTTLLLFMKSFESITHCQVLSRLTELASERVLRQADVQVVVVCGRGLAVLLVHHLNTRRLRVRGAGAHGHARHARHHHGRLLFLPAGRKGGARRPGGRGRRYPHDNLFLRVGARRRRGTARWPACNHNSINPQIGYTLQLDVTKWQTLGDLFPILHYNTLGLVK